MKIVHTLFAYDSGRFRGGVTKAAAELASAQAAIGLDVEIWAPHSGPAQMVSSENGVTVRLWPARRFSGMTWSPAMGEGLMRLPSRTVVHSHSIFEAVNWQTARAARHSKLPMFAHCHGAIAPELIGALTPNGLKKRAYCRFIEIPNLNSARTVFALTDIEQQRIEACNVRSPIQVVPNGVVLPRATEAPDAREFRATLGMTGSDIMILFLGRINPIKQVEHIIDAFALTAQTDSTVHLVIAGSATTAQEYYRQLQEQAAGLPCVERVHWIGHVTEASKPGVFGAADLFVHASRSEGMSMAILEAMSYGKCVVVSPGCHMGPAAKSGALLEVPDGVAPLAAKLSSLAKAPSKRAETGARAREYVSTQHDWYSISRRMASTYELALIA